MVSFLRPRHVVFSMEVPLDASTSKTPVSQWLYIVTNMSFSGFDQQEGQSSWVRVSQEDRASNS